jgi:hypothetical protein
MSQDPKLIPVDGVSKKLKTVVIILTTLTLFAFVALFIKLASKPSLLPKKFPAIQEPESNSLLRDEYQSVGTRLMNSGLKEQAIDQFIEVWKMQKVGSEARKNTAQTVGRLYVDLDNCNEALIWLFRAELSDEDKTVNPLVDGCLGKIRSDSPNQ